MGGGYDEPVVDECSAAEEQPIQSYGHVPRVFAHGRIVAADDSTILAASGNATAAATAAVRELWSLFFGRCPTTVATADVVRCGRRRCRAAPPSQYRSRVVFERLLVSAQTPSVNRTRPAVAMTRARRRRQMR